ncbi:MAG TPA: biopolymer transporter ExbD [Verrucomicrobiota bacterium]|nr:biopolymer transporter ExbD [Verrucomicrobiota bacterium]
MKLPRNARVFSGSFDAAPYASVFLLFAMFLTVGTLVYTPGVNLNLPVANDLPGTDKPTVAVAVDSGGRLFFQNQIIERDALQSRLREIVRETDEPLTLVVQADKAVAYEKLVGLALLARDAGIHNALLATLPRAAAELSPPSAPPAP